jgi:hypothetical protein
MSEKKRRLSNFNFEVEGAHVALVSKKQGGPANGITTLITKSTKNISEEQVAKATKVEVTLSITDFLTKFFGIWYEDAVVLAKIMGLDTEPDPVESDGDWYENYINERVSAVTLMKSLVMDKTEAEINKSIASLTPDEFLSILEVQKQFESNLSSVEGVNMAKAANTPSTEDNNNKVNQMSDFVTKAVHDEAVTKAVEEAIAKAKAEQEQALIAKQAELEAALEIVKAAQEKEKADIEKGRKAALKEAGVADEKLEELHKSMQALDDAAFAMVVKAMEVKEKALAESDLMKEVGVSGQGAEPEEVDGVVALTKSLEQKYAPKQ